MARADNERAIPAESGIIRYFSRGRYLPVRLAQLRQQVDTWHLHKN
jgi:hypothetical protein